MTLQRKRIWQLIQVFGLILIFEGMAAALPANYLVKVDTSAVDGASGFLDFQFNPGNATSQLAFARISLFQSAGGTLIFGVGSPDVLGDVSGALPGDITFDNATAFNDYFQQVTFGTSFSFILSLTGPALSAPDGTATAGSTFSVGLFDQDQNVILTNQSVVGQVDVNLDGSTTVTAFPTANGGPSVFSAEIPEPTSLCLSTLALFVLAPFQRVLRLRVR